MVDDLFAKEERVLEQAKAYLEGIPEGGLCEREQFAQMTKAYSRLLRQLRRLTKISDRTADGLNTSRIDLQEQVNLDALTNVYSRGYMEKTFGIIVKTLERTDADLSVLMMDVDYFKRYNDTYGHQKGDECLQIVAKAIQRGLSREADFVARYGGEEFAAILPGTDQEGACLVAERILENVRQCRVPHEQNEAAPYVTISIGVTTGKVTSGSQGGALIQKADEALYYSKNTGRNRYAFFPCEEVN